MGIWYQRWTDARPSRRVLCWLIASGLVAWAIWGLLLRPAALRYADIQAQAISAEANQRLAVARGRTASSGYASDALAALFSPGFSA